MPQKQLNNGHTILIVEDNELMRLSLTDRLSLEGFAVLDAATVDGVRLLLSHGPKPSLVITDVRLPDGNGAQIFEMCRSRLPGVPVIIMTAYGSVADAVRLVKAGALDYLEQPFNLDQPPADRSWIEAGATAATSAVLPCRRRHAVPRPAADSAAPPAAPRTLAAVGPAKVQG